MTKQQHKQQAAGGQQGAAAGGAGAAQQGGLRPREGDAAPDFTLPSTRGELTLSALRGKRVLLYFYPQDMTPTCTDQACLMRDAYADLLARGVEIVGISPDSVERHHKFAEKYGLPFTLAADEQRTAAELYGVWQLKKLYGREYMGIVRSTFLIDETGVVTHVWRNIRLKGHLDKVSAAIG